MEFRTIVDIPQPGFRIEPFEPMLFVGSCFADSIGRRFEEEQFETMVNPFGVMYNPVSILHTVRKLAHEQTPVFKTAFLTLGTNHVYRLKETGEIVDNCQKRPQSLFTEEELSIAQCIESLAETVSLLRQMNQDIRIVLTVSPIRYRKYGYHGSQLSKSTLLLAVAKLQQDDDRLTYFPAYEIVNDELRDYRFYAEDMLHPSQQAVEYIWERLSETYLSDDARQFIAEWQPIKAALRHRPFNPDSEAYRAFMAKTMLKVEALQKKYPTFAFQNR